MTLHIYCRHCDRSGEYDSQTGAENDGWEDVDTVGVTGPSTTEGKGVCPTCTD